MSHASALTCLCVGLFVGAFAGPFVGPAAAADDGPDDDGPRLEYRDDSWELGALPPILDDDGVRSHLTTGLTTSLALRVVTRSSRGRHDGGALVTVRYELWDEVFEVAVFEPSAAPRRVRLESFEELASWWSALRLRPLLGLRPLLSGLRAPPAQGGPELASGRLEIDVLPFSSDEEKETRRWLSDSLDAAQSSSTEGLSPSADEGDDTLGRTFRLMMATSIRRRVIREYRFDLVLAAPPRRSAEETP